MAIKTLRKFWKGVTSNPLYALGALGIGSSLYGALGSSFFPDTYKSTISFLDMEPDKIPGTTTQSYRTGLGISGAPNYANPVRSAPTMKLKPATFLGMDKGLLYDIKKGLGQTISAPMKFGAMFGSKGSAYDYILGNGTWGQVKNSLQGIVPEFLQKQEGGVNAMWDAYKATYLSGGGGAPSGRDRGTGPQTRAGTRGFIDAAREARFQSGQTGLYKTNGISARLLGQVIPVNDRMGWVDRDARNERASGPNLSINTSIKVGGRYTRTRS